MATNGTTVFEIADGIYRISTPVDTEFGGFSFNQYLVVDEQPLLFHTGQHGSFPSTREAIARVLPPEKLRFVVWSHWEADECGALDDFLAAAPGATPACSAVGAMISGGNSARPARGLADGEPLSLGRHEVAWLAAPHVPHGWDCGFLFERRTQTLFCGDLFTQGGKGEPPLTTSDVLGPSEGMRAAMDYYAHGPNTRDAIERLAALEPRTLACMHGSAYEGDGAALLRGLADAVAAR
jgi:flavorubredoxin